MDPVSLLIIAGFLTQLVIVIVMYLVNKQIEEENKALLNNINSMWDAIARLNYGAHGHSTAEAVYPATTYGLSASPTDAGNVPAEVALEGVS